MYEIGLSTNRKHIDEELFKAYRGAGISAMEISVPYEELSSLDFAQLQLLSKKYDVKLWSFHLPFMPFDIIDISSIDENIRQNSVDLCAEYIKKAANIGINKFVIHPSGEPISDIERKTKMEHAKESLDKLSEIAHKEDSVVAVENLPRTCLGKNSSEMIELIAANDKLRVCFDTNHLLTENIPSFIQKLGDRIATVHISDCDFMNERHWLPGEGSIDWESLLKALESVNYAGPWLYEIAFTPPNTIIRSRDLTCHDFYRNAMELFSGKPFTILSKHKENLGMWE